MSYLFSTGQYSESATESLEFRVGYHHVEQDLKSRLKKTLRALLTQLNALNYEEFFLNFLREHVTEKLDFVIFAKWMEIQIPDVSSELHNVLQQQDEILKIELLNIGARFFKVCRFSFINNCIRICLTTSTQENEKLVYGDLEGARLKLITYPLPTLSTHVRNQNIVHYVRGYSFFEIGPIIHNRCRTRLWLFIFGRLSDPCYTDL